MKTSDPEWDVVMKAAFDNGYSASSILKNPYWKTYPKDDSKEEESKARHWVDGYYRKLLDEATV